jgi:RNA polymerase sigma factor (sigma-70 family)
MKFALQPVDMMPPSAMPPFGTPPCAKALRIDSIHLWQTEPSARAVHLPLHAQAPMPRPVSTTAVESTSASHVVIGGMAMLTRCLQGDPIAVRAVVDDLTPVIQARAARAIVKRYAHRAQRRDLTQEVEELTQEVFASLFANNAATLRSWDPSRGLSLRNFVGLVAEREIANIVKSGRRRPWSEERTVEADDERHAGTTEGPELPLAARELVGQVLEKLKTELSAQGYRLFELLLLDEKTVEEVCSEMGLSRDAVYAWRSRLPKLVRRCAEGLMR